MHKKRDYFTIFQVKQSVKMKNMPLIQKTYRFTLMFHFKDLYNKMFHDATFSSNIEFIYHTKRFIQAVIFLTFFY